MASLISWVVLASDKGPSSGVTVTVRFTPKRLAQPLIKSRPSARMRKRTGRACGLFCKGNELIINNIATARSYKTYTIIIIRIKPRKLTKRFGIVNAHSPKVVSAADLAMQIESDWAHHLLWRDQFLGQVIDHAIEKKDLISANYAITKIHSPLNRASSMQKVAVYFFETGDLIGALEHLNAAAKLINLAENNADKSTALLKIIPAFIRIDKQRIPELSRKKKVL